MNESYKKNNDAKITKNNKTLIELATNFLKGNHATFLNSGSAGWKNGTKPYNVNTPETPTKIQANTSGWSPINHVFGLTTNVSVKIKHPNTNTTTANPKNT